MSEAFWGMRELTKERMKGDDPEIDTAQTPKRFDWRLALQGENPTFADSIPNKAKICFTHCESCGYTLRKFKYYATFCIHGTTLHGSNYVREIKGCFTIW